jgi:hypothetical protein
MLNSRSFSSGHVIAHPSTAAFAAFIALALSACTLDQHQVTAPSNRASSLSVTGGQADLDSALAVHRRHTFRLIAIPGIVGTAVGLTADRRPAIKIFTKNAGVAGLPDNLEGIPVEVQVTGELLAWPARDGRATASGCTPSTCTNTEVWPLPVPIGVSTGSNALLLGQCFSGTIGARVKGGGAVYALSNNHVYALENTVPLGTIVLQPGLADTQCDSTGSNRIGTLSAFAPIAFCGGSCPNNTIDAAIAVSDVSKLGNQTPAAGYGAPLSAVWPAMLGLGVKKYGRTTSLTTGTVTGIDATLLINYDRGQARFVHQIVVGSCPTACSRPGDSGSLWVTNDADASAVGLEFAGDTASNLAFANQIGDALTYFGTTVDGNPAPTASGGLTASGGSCGLSNCQPNIVSVTASGSNSITVRDIHGNTGTLVLSGFTASGGLTSSGGPCGLSNCDPAIVSITASGGNVITLQDIHGNMGTLVLSGATALGGLTSGVGSCGLSNCTPAITSVTGLPPGSNAIFLTEIHGNTGYIKLSF